MLSLAAATAYIVDYVNNKGKLTKLGKMKLFKILYLADWEKFRESNKPLFDIKWYRIQKGPALTPNAWQDLCALILEKYGIETSWGQPVSYPQVIFDAKNKIKISISGRDKEYINRAINDVIDTTAEAAAKLTYQTEPMKWLVAQELALGGNVQFREFGLHDESRIKFAALAQNYRDGLTDVPQIVEQMGQGWTNNSVVLFLEVMGFSRDLSNIRLSPMQRTKILRKLLDIHNKGNMGSLANAKWVEETVTASQRIEGIYVTPDAFVEGNTLVEHLTINTFA